MYYEQTLYPKIEIYKDKSDKEWWWRITARNGEPIGASSEGFSSSTYCKQNLQLVGKAILEYCENYKED